MQPLMASAQNDVPPGNWPDTLPIIPTGTGNTISVYKQGATLFVQNPNPDFSFTVSLYTAKGVLVDVECFPQSEQNYVSLPIDALPAGRYRVMVVTAEGESFHATITL